METSYLIKLLKEISDIMAENKDKLIEMDGIVGDGDLGLTMSDGFKAAYDAVSDGAIADAGKLLFAAGKAMANKVPSTMGSLMATGLKQAGKDLKGKETLEDADVVQIFASYEAGVAKLGEAKVGDKTFLDGLHPAVESLQASLAAGESLADMAGKAAGCSRRRIQSYYNNVSSSWTCCNKRRSIQKSGRSRSQSCIADHAGICKKFIILSM